MRSPWLSREYKKAENINVIKKGNSYIIKNNEIGISLEITEEEFSRYQNEELNEIEWEKYFFRGLAIDKNCADLILSASFLEENTEFEKAAIVETFPLKVKDDMYQIIINPTLGSWMALTKEEYAKYEAGSLTTDEWLSLYIRGLSSSKNDVELELDFPIPANYPSVIVVNITTGCNLRCKYCFADCGPFTGEDMTEEVMDATIHSMLSMPEVKVITFEFQGGEASTNVPGMRKFIEKVEAAKSKYDKLVKYRTEINAVSVTDDLISLIKKYSLAVGVSIDGPKEMTDQTRVDVNGNGAFDRIENGVKKLRESGIYIDGAVCTVGQHNVHYPKQVMKYFDQIGMNFKPRPVNILGREKENNLTTKLGEWSKMFREMHGMREEVDIENFSIHIFEENVYTPIRDYICLRFPCGAGRELVSVNPTGEVYPCDGFKGESEYVIGNVLNETIEEMLKKPSVQKLRSRTSDTIERCSTCLFRGMCTSCAYSAYGKFGTVYKEDPHCYDRRQIFIYLMQDWIDKCGNF